MGIHHFSYFCSKNIDCGYSLEPPRRGSSNEYTQSIFEQKYEKYQNFSLKLSVFGSENLNIFEEACFRNAQTLMLPINVGPTEGQRTINTK